MLGTVEAGDFAPAERVLLYSDQLDPKRLELARKASGNGDASPPE